MNTNTFYPFAVFTAALLIDSVDVKIYKILESLCISIANLKWPCTSAAKDIRYTSGASENTKNIFHEKKKKDK